MDYIDFYDLDIDNQEELLSFDLYEDLNDQATQQLGSLKSSGYEVKKNGGAIYDNKASGHRVTVERILWIDGWGQTTFESEKPIHDQEMTLVVLKIVLASQSPKKKFRYMKASLSFESVERSSINEPQVQAWAPFQQMTRWNKTVAHYTKSGKREGNLQVGYSLATASGSWSSEGEVSWDRTAFDEGRSSPMISPKTGNRNGVTWIVDQNNLENAGVCQELWVAVLLSRLTAEPYMAKFEINTRVGTVDDFRNKTMALFGLDPGTTKPFKMTPWTHQVCHSEGHEIMKCIDINNLYTLRCPGKESVLEMKWGPSYQFEAAAQEELGSSWATKHTTESNQAKSSPVSSEIPAHVALLNTISAKQPAIPAAAETIQPQPQLSLPPLVVGWYNPGSMTNVESSRLAGLEERMARLEARLYEQDSRMLELQRKLLEKEQGWQH